MTRIEWNEGLELGVEMIDKQHRHLIGLANKLLAAGSGGDRPER